MKKCGDGGIPTNWLRSVHTQRVFRLHSSTQKEEIWGRRDSNADLPVASRSAHHCRTECDSSLHQTGAGYFGWQGAFARLPLARLYYAPTGECRKVYKDYLKTLWLERIRAYRLRCLVFAGLHISKKASISLYLDI